MRRLAAYILLFTSAPPTDGGTGATYVLLRKAPLAGKQRFPKSDR
jgi:DNA-nicking Smr family endonuclease